MSPPLLPAPHLPRTNHTAVCWLLHVRRPAAVAAALASSPRIRFAAMCTATARVYLETRWPPQRASALLRLLDGLVVEIQAKPTTLGRDEAVHSIGQLDWHVGDWHAGGQGARVDRKRPSDESGDDDDSAANASE